MELKKLLVFVVLFSAIYIPITKATVDEFGDNSANDYFTTNSMAWIWNATPSSSGWLKTIGVNLYSTDAGGIIVALYNSTWHLISNSTNSSTITGWNNLTVNEVYINAGSDYKIALFMNSSNVRFYRKVGVATLGGYNQTINYTIAPTSLPSYVNYGGTMNMRLTYLTNDTNTNLWLNGTDGDYSVNYTSSVNITATHNTSATFSVSMNGTQIASGTSSIQIFLNKSNLATGDYMIMANWTGNVTHGNSSSSHILKVNKTASALTLSVSPSWLITEGTQANVTCTAIETPTLYKDNNMVANPYVSSLAYGVYNFTCTLAGNYTANSVTNLLSVVSGGFGCTNTTLYAFQMSIASTTVNTVLNFTNMINSGLVKSDLTDVWIDTVLYPTSRNTTVQSLLVNNSNTNFIIQFGNYLANNSYPVWNGSVYNITNITSGYTQLSDYYNLIFSDEETGAFQTPPTSIKSLTLYCSAGVSAFTLDNSSSSILIPTISQLDSVRATVTYSSTSSYYRDYLISSPVESKYVFLVDAFTKSVLQVTFNLDDNTGNFGVGSILRMKKYLGGSLRTITELPFDMELKSIAYLVSGDKYQVSVDSGIEEKIIGDIYTDPSSLSKTITINDIHVMPVTQANVSYNLSYSDGVFSFSWKDLSNNTNLVEFWVYNYTNTTSQAQIYYTSSSNRSIVNFVYTVPDANKTYMTKWLVHHSFFGNNTNGAEDVWPPLGFLNVINPFMTLIVSLGGDGFWFLLLFIAPIPFIMPRHYIGVSAFIVLFIIALLKVMQWITIDWMLIGLGFLMALFIELQERRRWRD